MLCHYLCRYTSGGITYYTIGTKESIGLFSLERDLLKIENGVISKMFNNNGNPKILIKTVSDKTEVFGDIYIREHSRSRLGHVVRKLGKDGSNSTPFSLGYELYKVLEKLMNSVADNESVTVWLEKGSLSLTIIPGLCRKGRTQNSIAIYTSEGSYEYTATDYTSTEWRYIWV